MRTIVNLVRLQFKIFGDETLSRDNIRRKMGYFLPIALCVLAMAGVLLYAVVNIAGYFVAAHLPLEFLNILFLAVQAIQFVLGISVVSNTLFGSENEDLLKLPVSGVEIFSSKIIYLYLHELLFSTSVILPTLIVFGLVYRQAMLFYLMIIPVCLLFPMFPFVLALLASIPAMLIRRLVKTKFLVLLLGSVVSISVGYIVYMYALELILNVVFLNQTQIRFTPEVIDAIMNVSRYMVPQSLLTNMMFGQDVLTSLTILILAAFLAVFMVLLAAKKWYYIGYFHAVEGANNLSRRRSKLVKGGEFRQLIHREFLNIFRSPNYSFQFLAIAASTPVMVFFCCRLTADIGVGNVGELIVPGITVLVVTMFIALSSSFSASALTREGNKMYHMKLIPSEARIQILAKTTVYASVSILSILASCCALLGGKYLDFKLFAVISVACILIAIGGICNSVKRDIKNPAFKDLGMGEMVVTSNNTMSSIAIGILVSLIAGGGVIGMYYTEVMDNSMLVLLCVSLLYSGLSILRLFYHLPKVFDRIEP